MKTTEIFVEQVLIGFLVLAVALLPFYGLGDLKLDPSNAALAALLVGVAYLLGIVFDRAADTLLARHEKHCQRDGAAKDLRVLVLEMGGDRADWADYLRSRIRLVRSLAIFLPALTVSAMLAARHPEGAERVDHTLDGWALLLLASLYGLALLAVNVMFIHEHRKQDHFEKTKKWRPTEEELRSLEIPFSRVGEPAIVAAIFLAGGVYRLVEIIAECNPAAEIRVIAIAVVGTALTVLAGWTWWRISGTYFSFLKKATRLDSRAREAG